MEFNKYDYFYSSKNNICEFEHEKRIIILTLKKEERMKIMRIEINKI